MKMMKLQLVSQLAKTPQMMMTKTMKSATLLELVNFSMAFWEKMRKISQKNQPAKTPRKEIHKIHKTKSRKTALKMMTMMNRMTTNQEEFLKFLTVKIRKSIKKCRKFLTTWFFTKTWFLTAKKKKRTKKKKLKMR